MGVLNPWLKFVLHHHQLLLSVEDDEWTKLRHIFTVQQHRNNIHFVGDHTESGEGYEIFVQLIGVFEILLPKRVCYSNHTYLC